MKKRITSFSLFALAATYIGIAATNAAKEGFPYVVGRGYFKDNPRGQIIGDMSGMIKLIFSPQDKKLLGVHIIGEQASELIHIGAHVMIADGTIDAFIQAIYNYPTLAGLYKDAAKDGLVNLEKWKASMNSKLS